MAGSNGFATTRTGRVAYTVAALAATYYCVWLATAVSVEKEGPVKFAHPIGLPHSPHAPRPLSHTHHSPCSRLTPC